MKSERAREAVVSEVDYRRGARRSCVGGEEGRARTRKKTSGGSVIGRLHHLLSQMRRALWIDGLGVPFAARCMYFKVAIVKELTISLSSRDNSLTSS